MVGSSGFPNQVNVQPGVGVEGDFADTNPRTVVQAGAGALVAGPLGVLVGRWAWLSYRSADDMNAPAQANNFYSGVGPALPAGLVHREQQGLITIYLQAAGMQVPSGFPVTLFNGGGFFMVNRGAAQALQGMYAYANFADGSTFFAVGTQAGIGSASSGGGATVTGSIGPQAATFTGSISGSTLTVTALATGTIAVGGTLSGTGGAGVVAGTQIVSQLSGTPGGVGSYALNVPEQTIPSSSMSEAYGLLTTGTVSAGTLTVGMLITGSGVISGTAITAFGTGAGGTGTYIVNASQTVGAETLTGQSNVQTKFIATTAGTNGELVKITNSIYG
jgi:hypothetical protein